MELKNSDLFCINHNFYFDHIFNNNLTSGLKSKRILKCFFRAFLQEHYRDKQNCYEKPFWHLLWHKKLRAGFIEFLSFIKQTRQLPSYKYILEKFLFKTPTFKN